MPELPDVREALAALELFDDATGGLRDRLAVIAEPFVLDTGEYLFREGDPGDRISLLASGALDAVVRLPGGREHEIQPLAPGVLIGEMAVLAARPRRSSLRATEPSTGWSFDVAALGRLDPAEQRIVVRRLGRVALERLAAVYERLGELCAADPRVDQPARPAELVDPAPLAAVEREQDETAYLETVLLFSQFSSDEIEDLFGDLRRLDAPRGATVISAGEDQRALYIVLRGAVETTIRRGGVAARARLAGPGRVVGHLGLTLDPSPATARAREHAILLEIPIYRVAELTDHPDSAGRKFGWAVYADAVDALFEAGRPIERMAAAGP